MRWIVITAPRHVGPRAPAVLTNRKYGLYTWNNRAKFAPEHLSANIIRDGKRWTARLFVGDFTTHTYDQEGLFTLYQVRRFLPLVAAAWARLVPCPREQWMAEQLLHDIASEAWELSAALELEHLGIPASTDEDRTVLAKAHARMAGTQA